MNDFKCKKHGIKKYSKKYDRKSPENIFYKDEIYKVFI